MKVLVCGDRHWHNYGRIYNRLSTVPKDTIVIHGNARGADKLGGLAAKLLGLKVEVFPADWERHGRAAGAIRNIQMLDQEPNLVVAFHGNLSASTGTKHCVGEARRRGIPVEVIS